MTPEIFYIRLKICFLPRSY
ncbi:hypothetical protein AYI68_g7673, partial [Smittium mucronatum]